MLYNKEFPGSHQGYKVKMLILAHSMTPSSLSISVTGLTCTLLPLTLVKAQVIHQPTCN